MFFITVKLVFIASLFLVFLVYFGSPSYKSFQQKDTVFIEQEVPFDQRRPMQITVYAWSEWPTVGWKTPQAGMLNITQLCNSTAEYDKLVECINNETHSQEDVVLGYAAYHHEKRVDVDNRTVLTQGITAFFPGKYQSIQTYYREDNEDGEYSFAIDFKSGLNYSIFLHDPDFYVFTLNPDTIPKSLISMDDSLDRYSYIKATYHKKMNKSGSPCMSSKGWRHKDEL